MRLADLICTSHATKAIIPVVNRPAAISALRQALLPSGTASRGDRSCAPASDSSAESPDKGNATAGMMKAARVSENHLMSMSASGSSVSLLYDGDGNRVAKTVNSVTTRYLVDDLNPTGLPQVMDEVVGGAVERVYTYGLQRISEDQNVSNTWIGSYYGYDGAGSVRQLTNSAGVVTDTYEYDAFGNKINSTGTTPNNYLYRGEQYDSDLGLYYLRARYYNTMTGRFVSMDPENGIVTDPKTLHKYLYANGDPINRIDPSGRGGSGVAIGGGDLGEYAGLIAMLFVGAQIAGNNLSHNSSSIASSLHQLGENLSCSFHRTACLMSGLASKKGRTWGNNRCQLCYDGCIRNEGVWPSSVPTTSGSRDCQYWDY
jgi:RHS repeat-associated protein